MHPRIFLSALAAVFSGAAMADSIDIHVSDDSVRAIYATGWRTAEFDAGLLRNSDKDSWVASVGLLAMGDQPSRRARTEVGVGGKIYLVSVGSHDVLALGLGGAVTVFPNDGPIGVGGYAFYAPDAVTGGDGEEFWEAGVRLNFTVVQNTANVYIGYGKVRIELERGPHVTVDSGGHVGLRINF